MKRLHRMIIFSATILFSMGRKHDLTTRVFLNIQYFKTTQMKVYKTKTGIVLERDGKFFLIRNENWDDFINDDHLLEKAKTLVTTVPAGGKELINEVIAPINSQEVWACGVTYLRSKIGRQEESKDAGGGDCYARVYEAERPEVFFKSTAHRVVGPNQQVRIRKDSGWDVPEPELTLVVTSSGKIVGYTIGNDMSSRSIEGENPLYLPQAKTYDGSAAIGPCVVVMEKPISPDTVIAINIDRDGKTVFDGNTTIDRMKRRHEELVEFLFREY